MAIFNCPVENARLTSKFGWREIGRGREWHQGVDLASPVAGKKVPIYASADGEVSYAAPLSTYGNSVRIVHKIDGVTYETNYAHLDKIMVKRLDKVKKGQQIGVMGNTGGSFGVHLHFEVHVGRYAAGQPNAKDPMNWITLGSCVPLGSKKEDDLTVSQYNELLGMINDLKKENAELKEIVAKKVDKEAPRKAGKAHEEDWQWAKDRGLTDGTNPQNFVTREQVGTMFKRFHKRFLDK